MPENEVTQIRINKSVVGIIGLEQAMKAMALVFSHRSDDEIGKEILKRVSEKNYIPSQAKELYAKAFVREFRKFLGQSVEETPFEGLRIVVLGPGCAQCSRLETDVRDVMAEMKLTGELLHTTDIREIGKYGVMGVPALVINDRVACVGSVPHKNKIKEWLTEATSSAR
jgi:Thioredoxin domain